MKLELRQPFLVALITTGTAIAAHGADGTTDTLLEKDASLPNPSEFDRQTAIRMAHAGAELVRLSGYRCDSVSGFRPMIIHRGWTLTCNHGAYEYEFRDIGGHMEISIEGRVIGTDQGPVQPGLAPPQ